MRTKAKEKGNKRGLKIPPPRESQKPNRQPPLFSVLLIFVPIQIDFPHNDDCTVSILKKERRLKNINIQ